MVTDANSPAAFYCPVHQLRFHAAPAAVIECEQAAHAIGYGFPHDSLWTYCCACATFSPHGPLTHALQLTECAVCEREVAKGCLCHSCQVLSIESVAHIHRKAHSIDTKGVKPYCPGCRSYPAERVVSHDCPELGISFLTARPSCPFCELELSGDAEQQNEAGRMLCDSCGAEVVAPYRFCRKCGKAQSRTGAEEIEQETFDEESFSESIDELSNDSTEEPDTEPEATYAAAWNHSPPSTPAKRRGPWLIGGVVALVAAVVLISVTLSNPKRIPRATRTDPPTVEAPPGMVYIAGGSFMMGNDRGDEYEKPAHRVEVAPFYMDVTEVTCEEYLKFLTATASKDPHNWTRETCGPDNLKRPATGLDWNDAKAYASWVHKRLPTEEEWEFAARGAKDGIYPWGNEWRPDAANAGDSSARRLTNVGSYPDGNTSAGVMDLIGNAWEWTASDVTVYPGGNLSSPIPSDVKVVRGGSWREANTEATSTYRGYLHTTTAKDYSVTGFRCVKDVGPSPVTASTP